MTIRKRKTETDEPESESEDVAADDPIVVQSVGKRLAEGELSEYQTDDGATYLLTAEEAQQRGAKAVVKPQNKAVTPSNK